MPRTPLGKLNSLLPGVDAWIIAFLKQAEDGLAVQQAGNWAIGCAILDSTCA